MIKKIILLAIIGALVLSSTSCSTINSNQLGSESTFTSSTEVDNFEIEEEIAEYYIDNVEHINQDVYVEYDSDSCDVSLDLAEYVNDEKAFYYPFAKQCIDTSKIIAEEYNIEDMSIDITFYSNSSSYLSWETDDFGASGTLFEKIGDIHSDLDMNCSLKDIKKKYKKFMTE